MDGLSLTVCSLGKVAKGIGIQATHQSTCLSSAVMHQLSSASMTNVDGLPTQRLYCTILHSKGKLSLVWQDIKDYCMGINRFAASKLKQPSGSTSPLVDSEGRRPIVVSPTRNASHAKTNRRQLGTGAQECARASRSILELDDGEYNSCMNLEWQVCAARGWLPSQRSPSIVFASAPGKVDVMGSTGQPALHECTGYAPFGCSAGYATDNIFFLEVCAYSKICENNEELFNLTAGKPFTCKVTPDGIRELATLLVEGNRASLWPALATNGSSVLAGNFTFNRTTSGADYRLVQGRSTYTMSAVLITLILLHLLYTYLFLGGGNAKARYVHAAFLKSETAIGHDLPAHQPAGPEGN